MFDLNIFSVHDLNREGILFLFTDGEWLLAARDGAIIKSSLDYDDRGAWRHIS
jgi:hypothetical protein